MTNSCLLSAVETVKVDFVFSNSRHVITNCFTVEIHRDYGTKLIVVSDTFWIDTDTKQMLEDIEDAIQKIIYND